ncbi:MAG: hypothetical protein IMZ65_03230, partial [Planctomycetes bacterium]|nr:hypothetical protein [Planctomycetota bacterium]
GYRVIQFGAAWASRVNLIARARDGTSLLYKSDSSGIDQAEWGRIAQAPVIIELIDKNDLARRAKQVALDAARLGRQVSVGLKLGSFRPLEDYAICDNLPVEINHGSVTTKDWASDVFGADAAGDASEVNANYWTILGLSWESYDDGHWMTNFALVPKGGGRARGGDCGATLVQSRAAAGSNLSSFALASAPAPGNLLVLAICSSAASLGAEPDLTTGWTRVHRIDGPEFGGYRWLEIWTRIAVSGDGASFGLSRNSGAGGVTCAYDVSEWSGGACGAVSVDDLAFDEITVNDFSGGGDTRTVTVTPTDARATTVFAVGWSGDNDTREPVEQGLTWASPLSEQSEQVQTNRGYVGVATVALSAGAAQSVTVTGIGATTPGSFAQTLLIAVNLVSGSFSYDVVSDPIVTPVESSTGWGPPTATTTSDTYTDLATGVVYERNDDTEVYDVVPGTGSVVDFTFTASVQWVINHTMGGYPRVTLRDTGGVVIDAEIVYTSTTVITVNFSSAVAGAAHLG